MFLPDSSPPADKNKLGFFITTSEAETQLEQYLSDGGCVLDNPSVDKLFTFQDMENNRNENGGENPEPARARRDAARDFFREASRVG